jgi:Holliday junction resolvase-like predicted endonuclease
MKMKPYAVQISEARTLLGGKCRSGIYEAAKRGELDFVRDHGRTLVTIESIERYQRSWPRAEIKAPVIHRAKTTRRENAAVLYMTRRK